jgi:lauroyl/myristoyl acyltransferase
MTRIFLADQKHIREKRAPVEKSDKTDVRQKKDEQSWGDTMGSIFKFIKWIGRHRIYRMNKIGPINILNGWGHLVGYLFFGRSHRVQKRIRRSIRALFPHASEKWIKKVSMANAKYMGMLLLDIIFRLPQTCDFKEGQYVPFFTYENFEALDRAFSRGKGVIIPSLHIGEHFHSPAIFLHPKKYQMSSIVSIKNLPMYEFNNRPHFDNLNLYASTSFSKISSYLQKDLKDNRMLLVYHDYSSKKQLRTPFIHKKFPYLIHTPQSYIRLHQLTGAEILPLITVPDKVFGKSILRFIDNSSIMEISKKYWNSPKKEFHGRLSTEINRVMYPYVRKYAHQWEELMRFSRLRAGDKLQLPINCDMHTFLQLSQEKMESIIEGSFEPDRKDTKILAIIAQNFKIIRTALKNPKTILRPHKTFIELSLMDAIAEITKISLVCTAELRKKGEHEAATGLSQLAKSITALRQT